MSDSSPLDPAEPYALALRYIKEGRWTEAKRKLDEVESIDAGYRGVANLQSMVDEVIETNKFGFGIPAHVSAQMAAANRPPVEIEEEDEPIPDVGPPPRDWRTPIACSFIVIASILICVGFVYLTFFAKG